MRELQPLPRSSATNVYDLLEDVKKVMLEEPKRVNMPLYITKMEDGHDPARFPACGTTGCIAGWVYLLAGRPYTESWSGISDEASNILGENLEGEATPNFKVAELCDDPVSGARVLGHLFSGHGVDLHGIQGGLEYAQSVVDRITKFQTLNESILRTLPVPPPPAVDESEE